VITVVVVVVVVFSTCRVLPGLKNMSYLWHARHLL